MLTSVLIISVTIAVEYYPWNCKQEAHVGMKTSQTSKVAYSRRRLPLQLTALFLVTNVVVLLYGNAKRTHTVQLLIRSPHDAIQGPGVVPSSDKASKALQSLDLFKQQLDLRYNITAWLQFAGSDASAHGTQITDVCNASHGMHFLEQFRHTTSNLCGSPFPSPGGAVSSINCSAYPVDNRGVACWAENVVLNATALLGPSVPSGFQQHSKYLPAGLAGSIKLNCHMHQATDKPTSTRTVWQSGAGAGVSHDELPWFKPGTAGVDAHSVENYCGPAAEAVKQPVMFVVRLDPTNPYHHTQTVIQAFLTLAAQEPTSGQSQVQVLLADHFEAGPFAHIWQRLSNPFPVIWLNHSFLRNRLVCFKHITFAHYVGPAKAFLGHEGIGKECTCPSTLMMAASHWLRYLFKELLPLAEQKEYAMLENTSYAALQVGFANGAADKARNVNLHGVQPVPQHRRLHVVWLSRTWFSRSMKAGGGLTNWQASRAMSAQQEWEVVKALEQAVLSWNDQACAPPVFGWWQVPRQVQQQTGCIATNVSFDFRFVELSASDLVPDQLVLLARTAVLVGVHGAALTNQFWMRPHKGAVVEFGAGGNFHYRNMAFQLGHKHFRLSAGDPLAVADAARQAMDFVSSRY